MVRRPPMSTRTDTLFPYTTLVRSAVRLGDLAVLVLEQIGFVAMKDARAPAREAGGVLIVEPFARRFDADDLDAGIVAEGVEQPDRVRSAADRGDQPVGGAGERRAGEECVSQCD